MSDQELIQLSQPDGGMAGGVGFAALGAAIGALPQARVAFAAIGAGTALTAEGSTSSVIFIIGSAAAIICLIIFGVSKYRNAGLTSVIRARPKMKGESVNV